MTLQKVPPKSVPKIEFGGVISLNGNPLVGEVAKRKIIEAVTSIPHEEVPAGMKRLRIYGTAYRKKEAERGGYHQDQRFTANFSYAEDGIFEAPWVLVLCYNREQGWYVVPKSIK